MSLSQDWKEITNETDLDDFDYGEADSISYTDLENIKYKKSSGSLNRNLSQDWSEVKR